MKHLFYTLSVFLIWACDDSTPKPRGFLRLDYETPEYRTIEDICNYKITVNKSTRIAYKGDCNIEVNYQKMKGTIYVNYNSITGNLDALLQDAQKFTYEHVIKADGISEQAYEDAKNNVYGMMYKVGGDAASQTQFYLTDSINHFISGSLYFYAEPNYDSILPAVSYIDRDIKKLVETFRWK